MTAQPHRDGPLRAVGMIFGLMFAPVATPTLIWTTVAVDVPLALVILQLLVLALVSNTFAHRLIHNCAADGDGVNPPMLDKSWSSEPTSG
ncbi:hypothetical protein [Mycobacterium simiae]|uniref:hypothetical protein n=1 Tax=Mycobacterium simiae TaxID=1784 RepID=UPI000428C537|nr:hypothetical protein [Mycobacterium simiae]PLV46340.1 hypothetical protein X011_22055 [Mycobacterium tuberculosis variant microti OV254]BBX41397.1 hypothetical protein MSIM_28480 [Mycobacterium simiae]